MDDALCSRLAATGLVTSRLAEDLGVHHHGLVGLGPSYAASHLSAVVAYELPATSVRSTSSGSGRARAAGTDGSGSTQPCPPTW